MIKGRSKSGPQEERGRESEREREETKEINGVDAEDRRMRISMITTSRRVIDNHEQMKHVPFVPFIKDRTISRRGDKDRYLKNDIDRGR